MKILSGTRLLFATSMLWFVSATQSCKKDSVTEHKISNNVAAENVEAVNLDSGLLCYLKFNHNLKDSSGHNNNGVPKNGTFTFVKDRFGNKESAINFGTTHKYIEIPEKKFVGLTKATISIDFYAIQAIREYLISKMSYDIPVGSPGFYQSFSFGIDIVNKMRLGFQTRQKNFCDAPPTNGWNPGLYADTATIVLNKWNNVTVTFNNTVQKMYLNGKLVASGTKTASPICAGEPIRLGVWWSQDPAYFTGNMDEVRIYNRPLTATEVKQLSKL